MAFKYNCYDSVRNDFVTISVDPLSSSPTNRTEAQIKSGLPAELDYNE